MGTQATGAADPKRRLGRTIGLICASDEGLVFESRGGILGNAFGLKSTVKIPMIAAIKNNRISIGLIKNSQIIVFEDFRTKVVDRGEGKETVKLHPPHRIAARRRTGNSHTELNTDRWTVGSVAIDVHIRKRH